MTGTKCCCLSRFDGMMPRVCCCTPLAASVIATWLAAVGSTDVVSNVHYIPITFGLHQPPGWCAMHRLIQATRLVYPGTLWSSEHTAGEGVWFLQR